MPAPRTGDRPEPRDAGSWLRDNSVTLAAVTLVVIQLLWMGALLNHSYFRQDDYFNFDRALSSGFTWKYLTLVSAGHMAPLGFALSWVLAKAALYNWPLTALLILLLVAASCVALLRVLRTLFGDRLAILVPLAVYLFSPLALAAVDWWSVAVQTLPLELAIFMAVDAHVRYLRSRRTRGAVATAGWLLLGMATVQKGALVPLVLFGLTAGFFVEGNWVLSVVRAVRRYWRAWLLQAILVAGYCVLFFSKLPGSSTPPDAPGPVGRVISFISTLAGTTLVPGAVGGPWHWVVIGDGYAQANPPAALQQLSWALAILVVVVSCVYRVTAWRAWAILVGWIAAADVIPVVIGRLGSSTPGLLGLQARYVTDAAAVLALCLGLAFLPLAGQQDGYRFQVPATGPGRTERRLVLAVLAVFLAGSFWSMQALAGTTNTGDARSYIATARAAVADAPRGTLIVDGATPAIIMDPYFFYLTGYTSRVIGAVARDHPAQHLTWAKSPHGLLPQLMIFNAQGQLRPAALAGLSSGAPGQPAVLAGDLRRDEHPPAAQVAVPVVMDRPAGLLRPCHRGGRPLRRPDRAGGTARRDAPLLPSGHRLGDRGLGAVPPAARDRGRRPRPPSWPGPDRVPDRRHGGHVAAGPVRPVDPGGAGTGMTAPSRLGRVPAAAGLGLALGLLALGPGLRRGFLLSYDMVAVPREPFTGAMFGLSGGPARAVPSDAVLAALSRVIPADLAQKSLLLAVFVLACAGAAALLREEPWFARLAAGVFYTWNPFVAERLIIGQWALLLGYAGLPWVLRAAISAGPGSWRAAGRLLVAMLPAAAGGFAAVAISALVAVPAAALSAAGARQRLRAAAVTLAVLAACSLPWLVPSLLRPVSADPAGVAAFAARADTPFGSLGSLLMLGGTWNAQTVPAGDGGGWSALWLALVVAAAIAYAALALRSRRWPGLWLSALAGLAIVSTGITAPGRDLLRSASTGLWPGFAVLRDGQQFAAPLALAEALGTGLLAAWVAGQPRPSRAGFAIAIAVLLAPVLLLPGLAWGAAGRLRPAAYPAGWLQAARLIDGSPTPGAVLLLPWAAYRNPSWNGGRTVLDPWPRLLSRPVIWNDGPRVGDTQLRPDDPEAARLDAAVRGTGSLIPALAAAGARFVIVDASAAGEAGRTAGRLPGCSVLAAPPGLTVYQCP